MVTRQYPKIGIKIKTTLMIYRVTIVGIYDFTIKIYD